MLYSHLLSKSQHNWQGLCESCRRVLCSPSVRVVFLTSWHLLNSWKGKSAVRTDGVREKRLQYTLHRYHTEEACSTFSTCARRAVSQASVRVVMSELLWRPRRPMYKLYTVWSSWDSIPTLVFCIRAGKTQQGFGCMPHYGNIEMFLALQVFEGWCHVYKLHFNIKVSWVFFFFFLRCVSFKSEVHTSSLRSQYVPTSLSETNGTWKRGSLCANPQRQMDGLMGRLYFTFPSLQVLLSNTLLV